MKWIINDNKKEFNLKRYWLQIIDLMKVAFYETLKDVLIICNFDKLISNYEIVAGFIKIPSLLSNIMRLND